jgi:gliding motility-associated-like protein
MLNLRYLRPALNRWLTILALSWMAVAAYPQNQWYFGNRAGLDFSAFHPMPLVDGQLNAPEGVAVMCDTLGKLLFYSDGSAVWDASHNLIRDGLWGDPSATQAVTIIPDYDRPDEYFLATVRGMSAKTGESGFNIYKIKIKSGEAGTVISDYASIMSPGGVIPNLTEKFLAIPFTYATNKTGFWFILHEFNSNRFVRIRYDGMFNPPQYISIGSIHKDGTDDDGTHRGAAGQMKVNDLRTSIAVAVEGSRFYEVFRFNAETGDITNPMQIPAGDNQDKFAYKYGPYGVEFSPTGRYGFESGFANFLFGSNRVGGQVYQWDLSSYTQTDLIKSGRIIHTYATDQCGALQMAPNGKIYIAVEGKDYLGVINTPMRPAPESDFQMFGARLINNDTGMGGTSHLGLPATIPSLKGPEEFYFSNLCEGDGPLFYITNQVGIITAPRVWTFRNLLTGKTVTKSSSLNEYTASPPLVAGSYEVTLLLRRSGITTPVVYKRNIIVSPHPVVQLIENNFKDTVPLCRGASLRLDAGFAAFYAWEDEAIMARARTVYPSAEAVNPYSAHRVEVTNYAGCVGYDTVVTRRENLPTATHSSIPAFCELHDGSATVIPNGRTDTYNYDWLNYPEEKDNVLNNVPGGNYVVTVTKIVSGCQVTDTIPVEAQGITDVALTSSRDSICPGDSVFINIAGASTVEWLNPAGYQGNEIRTAPDVTTSFRIKVTNYNNGRPCETELVKTVVVTPKNKPVLGRDLTPCGGAPVRIDGGEIYTEWKWSNGQTERWATVTGSQPQLRLEVKDENGCFFRDTIAIRFLPGPTITLPSDTTVCSKGPVSLDAGVAETYQWYRISGSDTIAMSSARTALIYTSGFYKLEATLEGCTLTHIIHVQLRDPDLFRIDSVQSQDISCFGANDGMIRIFATGEVSLMYYSIDNGLTYHDNGGLFEGLPPGNPYVISVFEDSVCLQGGRLVAITEPDSLIARFCSLAPSCPECNDGVISLGKIQGGTPPYQIRMNDIPQDSVIQDLAIGSYTLTVTDSRNCRFTVPVLLAAGTRPFISASVTDPVCPGGAVTLRVENSRQVEWIQPASNYNVEIVVNPTVTTTYRVRCMHTDTDNFICETILEHTVSVYPVLKPELGPDINACDGDTVRMDGGDYLEWDWSNAAVGRYQDLLVSNNQLILVVKDTSGCVMRDTVSVSFHDFPIVELGKDKSICTADPVLLSGGTGDTYVWSTGEQTMQIGVTVSGTYWLSVTKDGCSSTDSIKVRVLDPGRFAIDSVQRKDNTCYGAGDGTIRIVLHGTGTSYAYSIDDGITWQESNLFENLPAGDDYLIRAAEDSICYMEYGKPVSILQPDSIGIFIRLKSPSCETCPDGQASLTIAGGNPPYDIRISGEAAGPVISGLRTGTYVVTVTDASNCVQSATFTLELLNYIPNIITTNGDGVNDVWNIPMFKYYPDAVVRVMDINGRLVFESEKGYPVPWDGRSNGTLVPMGTYYYQIILGSGEQQLTGYLTIMR